MILIFLGPPGAGKGTQAKIIEERFAHRQISTGDLLRAHRAGKTALGREAQSYMDEGKLVPDGLIIRMMEEEIKTSSNVILDGFPRTVAQAVALDQLANSKGWSLPQAILFDVDESVLMERLVGRLTHAASGRTYHSTFNPPVVAGLDDVTGDALIQRPDDKEETIRTRLAVYKDQTEPLIEYYDNPASGRLTSVDALGPIDDVTRRIERVISVREIPQRP